MPLSIEDIDALVARWKECQRRGVSLTDYIVIKSKQTCNKCNVPVTKYCKSGLCLACLGQQNRKCSRPDKETLLQNLFEGNFSSVGAKYGVSDNAVRKWCRSYDLPFKARDIKRMRAVRHNMPSEGSSPQ